MIHFCKEKEVYGKNHLDVTITDISPEFMKSDWGLIDPSLFFIKLWFFSVSVISERWIMIISVWRKERKNIYRFSIESLKHADWTQIKYFTE